MIGQKVAIKGHSHVPNGTYTIARKRRDRVTLDVTDSGIEGWVREDVTTEENLDPNKCYWTVRNRVVKHVSILQIQVKKEEV